MKCQDINRKNIFCNGDNDKKLKQKQRALGLNQKKYFEKTGKAFEQMFVSTENTDGF